MKCVRWLRLVTRRWCWSWRFSSVGRTWASDSIKLTQPVIVCFLSTDNMIKSSRFYDRIKHNVDCLPSYRVFFSSIYLYISFFLFSVNVWNNCRFVFVCFVLFCFYFLCARIGRTTLFAVFGCLTVQLPGFTPCRFSTSIHGFRLVAATVVVVFVFLFG